MGLTLKKSRELTLCGKNSIWHKQISIPFDGWDFYVVSLKMVLFIPSIIMINNKLIFLKKSFLFRFYNSSFQWINYIFFFKDTTLLHSTSVHIFFILLHGAILFEISFCCDGET